MAGRKIQIWEEDIVKKIFLMLSAGIVAASLAACGKAQETVPETTDVSVVQENEEQTEEIAQSTEAGEESDLPYWILKQDFGTPKGSFEGTLFHKDAVLPLDLSTIDPYAAGYHWFPNGIKGTYTNTIEEILASDIMINHQDKPRFGGGSLTHIFTQSGEEQEKNEEWVRDTGISEIYIYNLDESGQELPLRTCYENGWWAVVHDEYSNHEAMLQIEGGGEVETANQVLEKFGTPTYIGDIGVNTSYGSLEEWFATMKKEDLETYHFFYEYEDFTLDIGFQEMSFIEEPVIELIYAAYYPAPLWEIEKPLLEEGLIPMN